MTPVVALSAAVTMIFFGLAVGAGFETWALATRNPTISTLIIRALGLSLAPALVAFIFVCGLLAGHLLTTPPNR